MAVSYIGASATAAGTTSVAVPYPSSVAVGDLVVAVITHKPPTTRPATPTGWALVHSGQGGTGSQGVDTGQVRVSIYAREAASALSGTQSFTIASGNTCIGASLLYRKAAGEVWDYSALSGSDSTSGTAFSATTSAVQAFTSGDHVVSALGLASDTITSTTSAVTATSATFSAMTELIDTGTGNGNDVGIVVSNGTVTAGTATAAAVVTATLSGSTYGVGAAMRIRVVTGVPAYVGASGATQFTPIGGPGTASVTVPVITDVVAGDQLYAYFYGANNLMTNPVAGSGWAAVGSVSATSGSSCGVSIWYSKTATGAEASYVFSGDVAGAGTDGYMTATVIALRSAAYDSGPTFTGVTSTSTTHTAPATTAVAAPSVMLCGFGSYDWEPDDLFTQPTGMIVRMMSAESGMANALTSLPLTAAGSTGTKAATWALTARGVTSSMTVSLVATAAPRRRIGKRRF